MSRRPDLEARLEDLTALLSAGDADELHQALVLGSPAAYEREPMMPLCYFTQVHERSPEGALTTAVLLATDARFESTSRPLMHALAGTGLLSGDDLDLLAQLFVAAGPHVYWACPDNWFEGPAIVITRDDAADDFGDDDQGEPSDERDPATVAVRTVPPAVRRWAADHLVRRESSTWVSLRRRADELGGAAGGAVLRGILDAIDTLPPRAARLLRDEALGSARGDVRHAALHLLAADDLPAARRCAAKDPDRKIREWGTRLRQPTSNAIANGEQQRDLKASSSRQPVQLQASLF